MRVLKEAIVGNPQAVQDLIDSLNENVSYSKWPGELPLGGSVEPMVSAFLEEAFSIDPDFKNGLKIFDRISIPRRLFDTLSSIEVEWFLNNSPIGKIPVGKSSIDSHFSIPKTFSDTLPVTLRLNSLGYTIVEYTGHIRIGGNYRKDKENFGVSLKMELSLKYAQAQDFYTKLDPHTTNRYQDLDLEYHKVSHIPLKSFYKVGRDLPLFRKSTSSIKEESLSTLALLVSSSNLVGTLTGFNGEEKKIHSWIQDSVSYTVVEIEGLQVWNGSKSGSIPQPKLLDTLKEQVDTIPEGDAFLSVECDMKVSVYNKDNHLSYLQLATLSLRRIKNDYCATVIREGQIQSKKTDLTIDLNRLERDNLLVKDMQSQFEDRLSRRTTIPYKVSSKEFTSSVHSFLKELPSVATNLSQSYTFKAFLDRDPLDLYSVKDLITLSVWKNFLTDVENYDYSSPSTEEFIFDLDLSVFIPYKNRDEQLLQYTGQFTVELESPTKTNLRVSLKAIKLTSSLDRDYIQKPKVNRYSDLDY